MTKIESFVFFDIETTGLPFQERNQTKIIELSLVAALRKDIECTNYGELPTFQKITYVFNPGRKIHHEAAKLTGLTNKSLKMAPKFYDKINSLILFFESLPKPVCLVAHNGNNFDFKLIQNEFLDANTLLPSHLLCVDSLAGFRKILGNCNTDFISLSKEAGLLTDDDDNAEWPDLDISAEDWDQIEICCTASETAIETENISNEKQKKEKSGRKEKRSKVIEKVFNEKKEKKSFSLSSIYKRLLNKEPMNAHQAEADCIMLLECVVAVKEFLPWADNECKLLSAIQPFRRY